MRQNKKKVIGGGQTCEIAGQRRQNETQEEANARKATMKEHVAEKIPNETEEEFNARRKNIRMQIEIQEKR